MKYSIDDINCYKNILFVRGWAERDTQDLQLMLTLEESGSITPRSGLVKNVVRPDLSPLHGPQSLNWGFEAIFIFEDYASALGSAQSKIKLNSGRLHTETDNSGKRIATRQSYSRNEAQEAFMTHLNTLSGGRILEIGSRARSGISRRNLYNNHEYVGMDIISGENVDIVGDAHNLSALNMGIFDCITSTSVFEHLLMPWKVAVEAAKIMKVGGLIQTNTHQCWPIHDAPWDYWRFSDNSWLGIFNKFTGFRILKTSLFAPVHVVPSTESDSKSLHFGLQPSFAGSSCLAEKICEPSVDWNVSMDELVREIYPA